MLPPSLKGQLGHSIVFFAEAGDDGEDKENNEEADDEVDADVDVDDDVDEQRRLCANCLPNGREDSVVEEELILTLRPFSLVLLFFIESKSAPPVPVDLFFAPVAIESAISSDRSPSSSLSSLTR